jgi:hypothetical protein
MRMLNMLKFIFNKGKPEIEVEPDITFNITVDEEGVIREAWRLAREEYISKLADDFLRPLVNLPFEPEDGHYKIYFDPYMGARERGYQNCYNDMKEKIMDMSRAEIKYEPL